MSKRKVSDEELDRLYERVVPPGGDPGPRGGPSDDDLEEASERLFRGRDPYRQRTEPRARREVTEADLTEAYWKLFQ